MRLGTLFRISPLPPDVGWSATSRNQIEQVGGFDLIDATSSLDHHGQGDRQQYCSVMETFTASGERIMRLTFGCAADWYSAIGTLPW
jgi:hypothetical protein